MNKILIDKKGNVLNKYELEQNGEILSALEVIEMFKNGEITLQDLLESCSEVSMIENKKTPTSPLNQSNSVYKKTASNSTSSPSKKQRTGKLYAIGDIHGKWKAYQKAIEMTSPEDRVVILGDVIDRGTDGIKILQEIM